MKAFFSPLSKRRSWKYAPEKTARTLTNAGNQSLSQDCEAISQRAFSCFYGQRDNSDTCSVGEICKYANVRVSMRFSQCASRVLWLMHISLYPCTFFVRRHFYARRLILRPYETRVVNGERTNWRDDGFNEHLKLSDDVISFHISARGNAQNWESNDLSGARNASLRELGVEKNLEINFSVHEIQSTFMKKGQNKTRRVFHSTRSRVEYFLNLDNFEKTLSITKTSKT